MKEKIRPIKELALIYRGMNGDREAQRVVTLGDTEAYIQADTFEEFLEINKLPAFEQVLSIYKPESLSWESIAAELKMKNRSVVWHIINSPFNFKLQKILSVTRLFGTVEDNIVSNIWYKIKLRKYEEKLKKEISRIK